MKTTFAIAIAAALALATPVLASGSASSDAAKAMKDTIQSLGSGKEPARSFTGGWVNIAGPAAAKGVGQNNVAPKDEE